jgi:hypothetical protein
MRDTEEILERTKRCLSPEDFADLEIAMLRNELTRLAIPVDGLTDLELIAAACAYIESLEKDDDTR